MRYHINRIDTYYLDQDKKQKEIDTVKQILKSNNYEMAILDKIQNKTKKQEQDNKVKKWAKFTYIGRETRYITKLCKISNVKITYTTNNNLGKLLTTQTNQHLDKYDANGVYQLEGPTCKKKYIGQTERLFWLRFHKHYSDYKYANNRSKFTQHVLEEGNNFGPMNEIMEVVHIAQKGRMLDTLEKFYIYKETKCGNQINDKLTIQSNPVFQVLVHTIP